MTHDELLADINTYSDADWLEMRNALLAVVELHKPIVINEGYVEIGEEPNLTCECDSWNEYDNGYPCPTIQAIEKELG